MSWTAPTTRATGDLITASIWNTDVVNNLKEVWREVDYVEITSNVNCTSTSSAAPNTIITGTSQTYVATPLLIEFSADSFTGDTGAFIIDLWEDSTRLGEICRWGGSSPFALPGVGSRRYTPSAGTHQYLIRGYVVSGTGSVFAASANPLPAFLRITQKGV